MTLGQFLNGKLRSVEGEPVESISWTAGITEPIDQDTYDEKLDVLPPRWQHGRAFAFGEGSGPFSIFWHYSGEKYFVTHLDDADTEEFCKLARVRLYQ